MSTDTNVEISINFPVPKNARRDTHSTRKPYYPQLKKRTKPFFSTKIDSSSGQNRIVPKTLRTPLCSRFALNRLTLVQKRGANRVSSRSDENN